ncbi:MAG: TetR/AcrR family transcriptional regulator [Proteobacteria bacterium]|nr:MAG: TetR/AcrR family transcriptional regulator [Pseudomonadota bacterium]
MVKSTKQSLIEAAIDLFAEKGVHWVSFQQIGTRVGITQAALYKHFADKDDLLRECALHAASSGRSLIDTHVEAAESPLDKIRAYLRGNFEWQRKRPKEAVIILSVYYFGYNSKPLQNLLQAINQQSEERLTSRLKEAAADGKIKNSQLARKARTLHSLMLGELIKAVHDPKAMSTDQRVHLIWQNFEAMLAAQN